MSHVPHELAEEFPAQVERIQALKLADQRFATLVERYHTVNRALHRMEERIEPVSESTERTLRHERLRLKDEVSRALEAQAA